MDEGVRFEFPYDKSSFKDRYTRQSRSEPCSTIVAHLSKDGLMFIHPTQNRSLTPREAARIQSFPDWFVFPVARTHAFRLIGNAVPPLISEAIGLAVREFVSNRRRSSRGNKSQVAPINGRPFIMPAKLRRLAACELEHLARYDQNGLRALTTDEFLRGWHALLLLFPGLHPDNALDHGDAIEEVPLTRLRRLDLEEILTRRHSRSGWPVALVPIGREAWRRYKRNELGAEQFYCLEAQRIGIEAAHQEAAHRELITLK
jgi:DNA (cytosine-5)-methyltransferase 1